VELRIEWDFALEDGEPANGEFDEFMRAQFKELDEGGKLRLVNI